MPLTSPFWCPDKKCRGWQLSGLCRSWRWQQLQLLDTAIWSWKEYISLHQTLLSSHHPENIWIWTFRSNSLQVTSGQPVCFLVSFSCIGLPLGCYDYDMLATFHLEELEPLGQPSSGLLQTWSSVCYWPWWWWWWPRWSAGSLVVLTQYTDLEMFQITFNLIWNIKIYAL